MAISSHDEVQTTGAPEGKYTLQLALIVALFGGIGFVTAMNDVLVPHFKDLFQLTNVKALLVQFAFFGAYFTLAIPSGKIVGRVGYKNGIVLATCVIGAGLLLFLPASWIISYPVFLFALFVVGSGLALLQVAINPVISALGDPAKAASRLNLAGGLNSLGGTVAPHVGATFIFVAAGATAAELASSVRLPYAILGGIALLMALVTWLVPMPNVIPQAAENETLTGSAWNFRQLRFGLFAIFCYVGSEVALGSLLINYLGQPSMGSMTHLQAAKYVSLYWGGEMVGRFIGFVALRHVKQARALQFVSVMGVVFILCAIAGHGSVAMWAVVLCGLVHSVMWPCIFPMSIEGLGKYTSQASGLLVMMIVGGAVVPELQGWVADHFGYQHSFFVELVCYLYLSFFAFNGHKPAQGAANVVDAALPPGVV